MLLETCFLLHSVDFFLPFCVFSVYSYSMVCSPLLRMDAHGGTGDPCLVYRFAHSQKRAPSHAVRVATRRATAKFQRDLRRTKGLVIFVPTYLLPPPSLFSNFKSSSFFCRSIFDFVLFYGLASYGEISSSKGFLVRA